MMDMVVSMAFMAVYAPAVVGWMMVTDEMIEKAADAVFDFFFAPKSEPETHADMIVMFGEAADA